MSQLTPLPPAPALPELRPLDAAPYESDGGLIELGPCGLPLDPLDPATIGLWEAEAETVSTLPRIGGAGQAELSGYEEDDDLGGGDVPPDEEPDDEFDDFDDIDEDDFDDDFDDDFEEELDDDYEIEIEDEISAEFGLSGGGDIDIVELDDVEGLDDDIDIDLDAGEDLDEKE